HAHSRDLSSFPTRRSSDLILRATWHTGTRHQPWSGWWYAGGTDRGDHDGIRTVPGGQESRRCARCRRRDVNTSMLHRREKTPGPDRKSTRLNSSHVKISYA